MRTQCVEYCCTVMGNFSYTAGKSLKYTTKWISNSMLGMETGQSIGVGPRVPLVRLATKSHFYISGGFVAGRDVDCLPPWPFTVGVCPSQDAGAHLQLKNYIQSSAPPNLGRKPQFILGAVHNQRFKKQLPSVACLLLLRLCTKVHVHLPPFPLLLLPKRGDFFLPGIDIMPSLWTGLFWNFPKLFCVNFWFLPQ